MKLPMRRKRTEVTQICGVADEILFQFIQEEWVQPIDAEFDMFDDEDIARIMFIQELRERLGVNDEAVPVILHLVDQLNYLIQKSEQNLTFKNKTSSELLGDHQ